MSRGWKITASLLTLMALSFGAYAGVGINMLMQVCYGVTKYQVKGIDGQYLYLNLLLQVYNPSTLKVGIEKYKLDIYLNDTKVSNLSSDKPKTLEGEKINTLDLPVKIDYKQTFGAVKSQKIINDFLNKKFDNIFIRVKGDFTGRMLGFSVSKEIDLKYTLKEIQDIMNEPSTPCPI